MCDSEYIPIMILIRILSTQSYNFTFNKKSDPLHVEADRCLSQIGDSLPKQKRPLSNDNALVQRHLAKHPVPGYLRGELNGGD
jgi:hypothetical protein